MKALSVRAPWWWFILHAGKDIENRTWRTNFRGTVYVHAGFWWSKRLVSQDAKVAAMCLLLRGVGVAEAQAKWQAVGFDGIRAVGGAVVGKVDIVDCVNCSDSPWFFGPYGMALQNPVAFKEPVPCKGALGFFTLPDGVLAKVREQEACL